MTPDSVKTGSQIPVEQPRRVDIGIPLEEVVQQLCAVDDGLVRPASQGCHPNLPSQQILGRMILEFRTVLFPGYFGTTSELTPEGLHFHVGSTLDRLVRSLGEQIQRGFCFACRDRNPGNCPQCEERALRVTREFVARLPGVRRLLATDVQAAYTGDPAATNPAETILCYPGVLALMCHRLAHELYRLEVPLLPRIISEQAHTLTGIDIHPGARVGESCFIDHGTGVVIGETSEIGRRVRIYQGVTLGARSFPVDANGHLVKGIPRHPIVEDDVVIYGGATVLGRITIGAGSVIGGNVWLTHSVPPGSRVSQTEARQERYVGGAGI
jgi:serine O-acetyltransferase